MNREILFKGKELSSNEWVFGILYNKTIISYLEVNDYLELEDLFLCKAVLRNIDPETIGQYTGLKDKNGVKIFEGDVCYCNNEHYEIKLEENGGAYKAINIKKTSDKHFLLHTNDILQVVYNIHDK